MTDGPVQTMAMAMRLRVAPTVHALDSSHKGGILDSEWVHILEVMADLRNYGFVQVRVTSVNEETMLHTKEDLAAKLRLLAVEGESLRVVLAHEELLPDRGGMLLNIYLRPEWPEDNNQ